MQLKLNGKGNESHSNGVSGDLLVLIEEETHDKFVREGQHLHYMICI